MSIRVLTPGLLTTVQDLGRFGYQKAGVVRSGALDAAALRTANLLVGNAGHFAGLEMTLRGPTLRFEADALLALTGADLAATSGGRPVPRGRPVAVRAGTELAFGAGPAPGRAWLAVAGGVAVPPVLGSRSTYLRAALGGLEGRALRAADALPVGECPALSRRLFAQIAPPKAAGWAAAPWRAAQVPTPPPGAEVVVRALAGPEYAQFAPASQRAFWEEIFTVTTEADRMGCRLRGPALVRPAAAELLSSAVTAGTVQVPGGGQPLVLLADGQTIGGYPRLAVVVAADVGRLAQALPGVRLRFRPVALAEAQALYLAQEEQLRALARAVHLKSLL